MIGALGVRAVPIVDSVGEILRLILPLCLERARILNKLIHSWLIRLSLGAGLACGTTLSAWAQASQTDGEWMGSTRRWLDQAVSTIQSSGQVPLRMEVVVGALDSRLKLAPCTRVEPYLPPGTRLWGRTRLGLRCVDGVARWNVFLPVTIKAYGPAWVVRRDVAPGAVLSEADVMQAEVDWAEEASPIVGDAQPWVGQVAARVLSTGQALRQNMVRLAQVFQAGTQVRVIAQGPGFQIASDGQALSAGVVGQLARVRMDNGRIMSGVVLDARTVKLEI